MPEQFRRWIGVAFVTGLAFTGVVEGQQTAPPDTMPRQGPSPRGRGSMDDRQAMMETMRAQEKRLDALVEAMHAATGDDQRIRAVAAVVDELVAQHRAMHQRMMTMMGPSPGGMHGSAPTAPAPTAPSPGGDHAAHH